MQQADRPGWVEFAPVWSGRPKAPSDGYSDETIREVFGLAIGALSGRLSGRFVENRMISIRNRLEHERRQEVGLNMNASRARV